MVNVTRRETFEIGVAGCFVKLERTEAEELFFTLADALGYGLLDDGGGEVDEVELYEAAMRAVTADLIEEPFGPGDRATLVEGARMAGYDEPDSVLAKYVGAPGTVTFEADGDGDVRWQADGSDAEVYVAEDYLRRLAVPFGDNG